MIIFMRVIFIIIVPLSFSSITYSIPCVETGESKIERPDFSTAQLLAFKKFGDFLIEKTSKEDVIVFVGRSFWIVKYYFDVIKPDRKYYSISFSGNPFGNPFHPERASQDDLASYKNYLQKAGLVNALANLGDNRLFLVDYTVSGTGIIAFSRILADLNLINKNTQVVFAVGTTLYSQEIMERPDYAFVASNSYKALSKQFKTQFLPFSFSNAGNNEHDESIGSITGAWEFSLPGLGHFPFYKWQKLDPFNCDQSPSLDAVKENARRTWGR